MHCRRDLNHIIDQWAESNRIKQFFSDVERQAAMLEENERANLLDRLQRAPELIGSVDALSNFVAWKLPDER